MKSYYLIFVSLLLSFFCLTCNEKGTELAPPEVNPPVIEPSRGSIKVIEDEINGVPVVIAGSALSHFIVSFERTLEDEVLSFEAAPSTRGLPIIMQDAKGNEWDIFGRAVSGPRQGMQLTPTYAMMGYWFVFSAFYEDVQIFEAPLVAPHAIEKSELSSWLLPPSKIRDGGPGVDGIPALVDPSFNRYSIPGNIDEGYLEDGDLVVGIKRGDDLRLYPHKVLDWHEIVNDQAGGDDYALIYCPLTGTSTVWDRTIDGVEHEFGVTGLLYNSNIIPYDRTTRSYWTQLYSLSFYGDYIGQTIPTFHHIETTWSTWKRIAPALDFLSLNTGYDRNYGRYPYGNYRTADNLLYPIEYRDERLPLKERVHGVIVEDKVKVYRFSHFQE